MPVRCFGQLGAVFTLLFTLVVLGSVFRFQPLDPTGQIRRRRCQVTCPSWVRALARPSEGAFAQGFAPLGPRRNPD